MTDRKLLPSLKAAFDPLDHLVNSWTAQQCELIGDPAMIFGGYLPSLVTALSCLSATCAAAASKSSV